MEITKVGVLGCGLMGLGIAQVCATAGFDVTVLEVEQKFLDEGFAGIEKSLSKYAALDGIVKEDAIFASNIIMDPVYCNHGPVYCLRSAAVVRSLSRPPSADEFGMTRF